MKQILIFTFLITVISGCKITENFNAHKNQPCRHLLIDPSKSVPDDIYERIYRKVLVKISQWVERAKPGEKIYIWWLTGKGEKFPANYIVLEMPPLKVPAYIHRRVIASEFLAKVKTALGSVQRSDSTSLLEAIYLIASTRDESPWVLIIYSDLQQDTPKLSLSPDFLSKKTDSSVVSKMLGICLPVHNSPDSVQFVTWPGLYIPGRSVPEMHEKLRKIWSSFTIKWAGVKPKFEPIE